MKILYNSVNYEDGWRKKERGIFLPITNTPKCSTIVFNSVNDTQDFMCIEYKAFLPCKQHPTVGA